MSEQIKPWEDLPIHIVDGRPCGPMTGMVGRRGMAPLELQCVACGSSVRATRAQIRQARKADNAWVIEDRRQQRAGARVRT